MAMPMPMGPPPPAANMPPMGPMPAMDMPMPTMHVAFFWGHRVQVLFPNWPGNRAGVGMYLLCLLVVLALAALVETLSAVSRGLSRRRSSAVLLITGVHAAKMGLAYLVMLTVMSFNAGVLLAAVAGHAVGFLVARSGVLGRATRDDVAPNGAVPPSDSKP